MSKANRRQFLVGCSSAIAAMAGARLNTAVFGNPDDEPNQNILVVIFLRGGCDALSVIAPMGGEDRGYYEVARPDLAIPTSGDNSLLQLGSHNLGLHPSASHLYELYNAGHLSIIPATGMHSNTRSHFDAMAYMELGTPDSKTAASGWITRHILTSSFQDNNSLLPYLGVGSMNPTSLSGTTSAISMNSPSQFKLDRGFWRWRDAQKAAWRSIYGRSSSAVHSAGLNALDTVDLIQVSDTDNYTPENGAVYPNNSFGDQLQTVAQMIKLQIGLRVSTIDLGGWDTHESQAGGDPSTGYFSDRISMLSQGMHAFFTDLNSSGTENYANRVTTIVMSEFGRRLRENDNRGTDHGHGGFMFVMGGESEGGMHGTWPGLHTDQLYDNVDLAVTTDYRQVLSEILIRRFDNPNVGSYFPGYSSYAPSGNRKRIRPHSGL